MKQKIIKEVNPFYDTTDLQREQSITIDEVIIEKKQKPSEKVIEEMRYIKKKRKESKFYPMDSNTYRTIEYSIGGLVNEKHRGFNREKQVLEICRLLGELQKQRKIIDINRKFIKNILTNFSNLKPRTKQRILNEILKKAKVKRQRIIEKKYLVNSCHLERKLSGEKTISKIKPIDRIWDYRKKEVEFFSFV